jgi:hypothetical protein
MMRLRQLSAKGATGAAFAVAVVIAGPVRGPLSSANSSRSTITTTAQVCR